MSHRRFYGLLASIAVVAFVGGVWLGRSQAPPSALPGAMMGSKATALWTCSMHPHIHQSAPGLCPICGMPLVPTETDLPTSTPSSTEPRLVLSKRARAMASVETAPVTRRPLNKEIHAVGKIQYNETGLATVVSRVDGFIEKLFVDATGVRVHQGERLVEMYSQDLAVAQRELLLSRSAGSTDTLLEATRAKMRQWGVTDEEIEKVLKTGKALPRLTRYAPMAGTVIEKMVVEGSFVNRGDVLYRLANLDSVWVALEIYEYEIRWVQPGQPVAFTADALPGQTLHGTVTFISPTLHAETRTINVRVQVDNRDGTLKPGMFVSAVLRTPLLANGMPAPLGTVAQPPVLAVPVSAVLDSGTRRLVYLEKARGEFVPAEISIGPRAGEFYAVVSGLHEGDHVALRGNFLLDSQFQIKGLPSVLSTEGLAPATHQH